MLILQNITYIHPNKDLLFDNINLSINKQNRIALVGNNGAGKSTIFKLITGELTPQEGAIHFRTGAKIGTALQMVPKDKLNLTVQEYFETAVLLLFHCR